MQKVSIGVCVPHNALPYITYFEEILFEEQGSLSMHLCLYKVSAPITNFSCFKCVFKHIYYVEVIHDDTITCITCILLLL